MTIFLEIAKQILIDELNVIKDASSAADSSWSNWGVSFIGFGRDPDLSKGKRKVLQDLINAIAPYQDPSNDTIAYTALTALLTATRKNLIDLHTKKGYLEGETENKYPKLFGILDTAFESIKTLGLVDTHHDTDPLNILAYHIASYTIKKSIIHVTEPSMVARLTVNPKLTRKIELSRKKLELVKEKFNLCRQDLEYLNKSHTDYQRVRRDKIIGWANEILKENDSLSTQYGFKIFVPLQVSLLGSINISPSIQPRVGFLNACIQDALNEIDPPHPVASNKHPFSVVVHPRAHTEDLPLFESPPEEHDENTANMGGEPSLSTEQEPNQLEIAQGAESKPLIYSNLKEVDDYSELPASALLSEPTGALAAAEGGAPGRASESRSPVGLSGNLLAAHGSFASPLHSVKNKQKKHSHHSKKDLGIDPKFSI